MTSPVLATVILYNDCVDNQGSSLKWVDCTQYQAFQSTCSDWSAIALSSLWECFYDEFPEFTMVASAAALSVLQSQTCCTMCFCRQFAANIGIPFMVPEDIFGYVTLRCILIVNVCWRSGIMCLLAHHRNKQIGMLSASMQSNQKLHNMPS